MIINIPATSFVITWWQVLIAFVLINWGLWIYVIRHFGYEWGYLNDGVGILDLYFNPLRWFFWWTHWGYAA